MEYSVKQAAELTGKTEKNLNNLLRNHPEIPIIKHKPPHGGLPRNFVDNTGLEMLRNLTRSNAARRARRKNSSKLSLHSYQESSSGYWKVSVFDEGSGHFYITHCSLTYEQALLYQRSYIELDKISRVTPH